MYKRSRLTLERQNITNKFLKNHKILYPADTEIVEFSPLAPLQCSPQLKDERCCCRLLHLASIVTNAKSNLNGVLTAGM